MPAETVFPEYTVLGNPQYIRNEARMRGPIAKFPAILH